MLKNKEVVPKINNSDLLPSYYQNHVTPRRKSPKCRSNFETPKSSELTKKSAKFSKSTPHRRSMTSFDSNSQKKGKKRKNLLDHTPVSTSMCDITIKEELEDNFNENVMHNQNELVSNTNEFHSNEKASNHLEMCLITAEKNNLEHEPFLEEISHVKIEM